MKLKSAASFSCISFTMIFPVLAQNSDDIEKINIYSQTPISASIAGDRNPLGSVQTVNGAMLVQSQAISLAEHMKNQLVSLHINDVQNNPFQRDVQYRGFTASPLLGLPQGISVYLNGIRFNEPFGDTVNWDLIPLAALESVSLYSGSNPAFGQNTLGGALALQTKNGFSYSKNELDVRFGSFGQKQFTVQSGGNKGNWGYYFIANKYQEDGWRDYSESELKQLLTTLSYASKEHSFDITYAANKNELLGNGAVPEQLPALASRSAIYTQPDKTASRYQQLSLKSDNLINDQMSWQATAYYRHNEINSINGDDSDYEECESGLLYSLCEGDEDDDDEMEDEAETEIGELERVHFVGYDEDIWLSELTDIDADSIDGTYNTGFTDNKSYGAALQFVRLSQVDTSTFIGSFDNEFIFGLGIDKADIELNTNIPIIGFIGRNKEESNLLLLSKPKSLISEAFRTLRTNLQYLSHKKGCNVGMITSSVGGEGKTFCSMNIASSYALLKKKTILVGADLRKPRIFDDFGVHNNIGLSTLLIGNTSIDEATQKTQNNYLDLITSGPVPPNPSELLSSPEFSQLIDTLKTKYDQIILDTSPIGLVTDANILINASDVVLLVVRQKHTRTPNFVKISKELEPHHEKCGVIVNDIHEKRIGYGKYGYGYGYGYWYGYGSYGYGGYEETNLNT